MDKLISTKNLKKYFPAKKNFFGKPIKYLKAVDGVDIVVYKGETLGVVGESGCGKSTLGRAITRLYDATDGKIFYEDTDITNLKDSALREYQKKMQIIFQDPYSSLNPYMSIKEILKEPMKIHFNYGESEMDDRVASILEQVGLPKDSMDKFAHEFSGGQRQRVGIARALTVSPEFILCDEPISALDVSIQAQIVNTLQELQEETGISYLFIAHDLSMVKYISNRIAVMYLGKIVEVAKSEELYEEPLHPYTQALMKSIPMIGVDNDFKDVISGDLPSPIDLPRGCRFQSRCPYVMDKCKEKEPELKEINGREVACYLY